MPTPVKVSQDISSLPPGAGCRGSALDPAELPHRWPSRYHPQVSNPDMGRKVMVGRAEKVSYDRARELTDEGKDVLSVYLFEGKTVGLFDVRGLLFLPSPDEKAAKRWVKRAVELFGNNLLKLDDATAEQLDDLAVRECQRKGIEYYTIADDAADEARVSN